MSSAGDANPTMSTGFLLPLYDPNTHQWRIAMRAQNVTTDTSVTPNVVYGDAIIAFTGSITLSSDLPLGATILTGTSGVKANAIATATLTPDSGKLAYITGFDITGSGATAGLPVT